jgi:predicted ATPase
MLHRLEVEGYRSLRNVRLTLRPVTVLVGPNGCGKSNLYRALQLLVHSARGAFARSIAAEGGMPSVLWAGARRKGPVRMRVAIEWDAWRYEWACGLPKATDAVFPTDPWIKTESLQDFPQKLSR